MFVCVCVLYVYILSKAQRGKGQAREQQVHLVGRGSGRVYLGSESDAAVVDVVILAAETGVVASFHVWGLGFRVYVAFGV